MTPPPSTAEGLLRDQVALLTAILAELRALRAENAALKKLLTEQRKPLL